MSSIESQIADKIVLTIQTEVPTIKFVGFDQVFLAIADFREHELPAVQIYDVGQIITHERGRVRVQWALSIELIMKSLTSGKVDQKTLWELRRDLAKALFKNPNLGIPGVIHLVYTGNITDLHLRDEFYSARIDLDVLYYDSLVSDC